MAAPEEEENAAEGRLGSFFSTQPVVTNSQVAILLQQFVTSKHKHNPDYVPHPMIVKTQDYVNRFNAIKNIETANEVSEILHAYSLNDFEVGCIANLMPETADEARALCPTLAEDTDFHAAKSDEEIQEILDVLLRYKRFD